MPLLSSCQHFQNSPYVNETKKEKSLEEKEFYRFLKKIPVFSLTTLKLDKTSQVSVPTRAHINKSAAFLECGLITCRWFDSYEYTVLYHEEGILLKQQESSVGLRHCTSTLN